MDEDVDVDVDVDDGEDEDTPVTQHLSSARAFPPAAPGIAGARAGEAVASLLLLARHDSFAAATLSMGLLGSLLGGRRRAGAADNLGRSLWEALERSQAGRSAAEGYLRHSASLFRYAGEELGRGGDGTGPVRLEPRLCCVLDTLGILAGSEGFARGALQMLGREGPGCALAFLPYGDAGGGGGGGSSSGGLRRATTLAGATFLARLCLVPAVPGGEGEDLVRLRSELRGSLRSIASTGLIGDSASQGASLDLTRRALRLRQILGVLLDGSEDSAAVSMFASSRRKRSELHRAQRAIFDAEAEVGTLRGRVNAMGIEMDRLRRSLDCVTMTHTLTVSKVRSLAEDGAMGMQRLLVQEKEHAEEEATRCQEGMKSAEDARRRADVRAEEAGRIAEVAREENALLTERIRDLDRRLEAEVRERRKAATEADSLRDELGEARQELKDGVEALSRMEEKERDMNEVLRVAESAGDELRSEIERGYASLVSLAQLYQVKEEDLAKARSCHRDAISRTQREGKEANRRRRVAEERSAALESESREMKRTLAKVTKELEKERSAKASGPVGYFNRMHDEYDRKNEECRSRKDDGSERSRSPSRRTDQYRSRRRGGHRDRSGKENSGGSSARAGEGGDSRFRHHKREESQPQRRFRIER